MAQQRTIILHACLHLSVHAVTITIHTNSCCRNLRVGLLVHEFFQPRPAQPLFFFPTDYVFHSAILGESLIFLILERIHYFPIKFSNLMMNTYRITSVHRSCNDKFRKSAKYKNSAICKKHCDIYMFCFDSSCKTYIIAQINSVPFLQNTMSSDSFKSSKYISNKAFV